VGAALNHPVDVDETLGALSDLVHAGEIRAFGASNVAASEIVEAQWTAERRGRERFRTGLGRLLSSQNIVVATGGRLAGG